MKWLWPKLWDNERGGWWRVAVTVMLCIAGVLLGEGLLLAVASAGGNEALKHLPPYFQQVVMRMGTIITSSLGLLGCMSGVHIVHHKPVARVFTDGRPFSVMFVLQSAAIWLLLWIASVLLVPDRGQRLMHLAHELPLVGLVSVAIAMFCATSVQGTLEEVVFRGYLQPRVGAWVKRTWVTVLIVGLFFTAAHPDAWTGPGIVYIVGFSAALGIGGIRAGSIAPLCGIHAANNAMEWLWFPNDSLRMVTWPIAAVTVTALLLWLAWLFWMTRPKAVKNPLRQNTRQSPNVAPEPTAAGPSAYGRGGRFAAPRFRRRSVSGGCGSAFR